MRDAESLPEADFVVGFQNYGGLPSILQNALLLQDAPKTCARIQVFPWQKAIVTMLSLPGDLTTDQSH